MVEKIKKQAPDFSLQDQDDNKHRLSQYRGRTVLLYFYPKDDTPGCTTEACGFRDNMTALQKNGVVLLGISPDTSTSHKKFSEKYQLPFPLLADTTKEVAQAYGVWVEKSLYGRKYMGVQRDSFLIDENGYILKHYTKVNPKTHVTEVMDDLKTIVV